MTARRSAGFFATRCALALAASLMLAACGGGGTGSTGGAARPRSASDRLIAPSRPTYGLQGLESVMGQDSDALVRQFGPPRLDVVEAHGRRLQFSGRPCILDAYLYARGSGGRELVSHVDARNHDGAAVDRAACVAALRRR